MATRIGVVGVGFGALVHIPGFQSEDVEVAAICTRRPERAQEAAERFGIERAFTDYGEMLAMNGLDAVSIVTPVGLHHEMSLQALAAGKRVICEKPFALNTDQAREMWQAAQASGKTAMIAHEFRYSSGRMRAKELIDEGYVGQPRLCLMRLVQGGIGGGRQQPQRTGPAPYSPERDSAERGAGFLFGLGSHYIDCLRHWFGEVESVSGDLRTFNADRLDGDKIVKADADDTFSITLNFANGTIAHMVASRGAPFGSGAAVEIYGSEGSIMAPQRGVNPPARGTLLGGRTGDENQTELEIPDRLQPFVDDRDDRLAPFRMLVRDFVRGIGEGTSPAPNFYDGYRCQQVLDAVRESSATGRRVALSPD